MSQCTVSLQWVYNDEKDSDYAELKDIIETFREHPKNALGIGWTGTNMGKKKGGNNGAWNSQWQLEKTRDLDTITNGGRIYCLRASTSTVDGIFVNSARNPPLAYNPEHPLRFTSM